MLDVDTATCTFDLDVELAAIAIARNVQLAALSRRSLLARSLAVDL